MDEKTREGELVTTHLDTFEEETTVNVTELENDLINTKLEVELLKKEIKMLKVSLETAEETASKATAIAEDYSNQIESKDAKLVVLRNSINELDAKVNVLNNELTGKENEIIALSADLDNSENLAAGNVTKLASVKRHYEHNKPLLPGKLRGNIANWLMDGSIEKTREWFVDLYDILKG